jgi:ADP-ribose pyrophosphatase YjhB (NUDIX family)
MTSKSDMPFRRRLFIGARARLFHTYFLLSRPMTLGARGIVYDEEQGSIFLIRHTYVPGWQFPGGGVESGETLEEALGRELAEEGNIDITEPPKLTAMYLNRSASQRDHVGLFLIRSFRQTAPKIPDREIAESGFFPLDALPEGMTRPTRDRLAEIFGDAPVSPYW